MTTIAPAPNTVQVFGRQIEYKWIVAVVYVSALFLDILDSTIVNVAIPGLGRELHTENAEWVVLGYTLSLAVWIPTSGWLGDRFGTKRTFLVALLAFTGGSLLCGCAQTIGQLIAFRVIQGVGGGMLTPVGLAMLFRAFPPAERARAATLIMVPTLVAPALGPVLGGLIVTNISWRWIFLVNVPIGMVALWFGWRFLQEHKHPATGRFDIAGFILSASALALIVYTLSEGPHSGWSSPLVVTCGVIGVIAAVAMTVVELRISSPMLDLRLLHNRMFRQCNLVGLFSMASFLGVTFVMPLYLQLLRGMTPLASGLTTFPQAFGIMISSVIAGRLYASIGPRRLMSGAFLAAALAISLYTTLGLHTSLWLIRGLMFGRGLCMGFAFVPMQAASYATIEPAQNGRASSIFSTQRQVGVSLGVAIVASILAAHMSLSRAPLANEVSRALTGVRWAFGVAVILALLAAVCSWFIRDEDAEATMVARKVSAPVG
ncbi:MAG: DHA2 family efflux MFS transporter permease subunit [Ilumatobacteraceae bacterium]|nr:DHA2 family efflux MFS transporter permease subunit [Ilumatobacteraceae bacterium]